MLSPDASHYRQAIALMSDRRYADAARRFEAAIGAHRARATARPPMRYYSFLALARALAAGKPRAEDMRLCERAATSDGFDPVLQLNLRRVCLMAGMTTRALAAFSRGLRLDPDNRQLGALLSAHDRRRRPVFPGLGRDHGLNRSLGRLRSALGGTRHVPAS